MYLLWPLTHHSKSKFPRIRSKNIVVLFVPHAPRLRIGVRPLEGGISLEVVTGGARTTSAPNGHVATAQPNEQHDSNADRDPKRYDSRLVPGNSFRFEGQLEEWRVFGGLIHALDGASHLDRSDWRLSGSTLEQRQRKVNEWPSNSPVSRAFQSTHPFAHPPAGCLWSCSPLFSPSASRCNPDCKEVGGVVGGGQNEPQTPLLQHSYHESARSVWHRSRDVERAADRNLPNGIRDCNECIAERKRARTYLIVSHAHSLFHSCLKEGV